MSINFGYLLASGAGGPVTNTIVSDDLSDNPAAALTSRTGAPNPGSDIGAQWALHPGAGGAPTNMTADAVTAPGAFLETANVTGAWYSQATTGAGLVLETQLISNTANPAVGAGILFLVDSSVGEWNNWYIINHGGTGGGGTRVSVMNGTSTVVRISELEAQGIDDGVLRVELTYATGAIKFWTDYARQPAESGSYFRSHTITMKPGRSCGVYQAGGVTNVKRFSRYQYSDLGEF